MTNVCAVRIFKNSFFFFLFIFPSILIPSQLAAALDDPLKDLLQSPELRELPKSKDKQNEKELLQYVDPDTNYGSLVLEKENVSAISAWLSPVPAGFKILKINIRRKHEFLEVKHVYSHSKSAFQFYVKVLVPYPKFIDASGFGLIKSFSELYPPILKIDSTEDLELRGMPAKLYHRLDGSTSILIRYPKNSLINFVCTEPKAVVEMIRLAQLLPLEELRSRLDS